jgi:hypothetical protein
MMGIVVNFSLGMVVGYLGDKAKESKKPKSQKAEKAKKARE